MRTREVMATRNLTARFDAIRQQVIDSKRRRTEQSVSGSVNRLLTGSSDSSIEHAGLDYDIQMPPMWIDIQDQIRADLSAINQTINQLVRLHEQRTKIQFGDELIAEQERDIELLTASITRLLRKCEAAVKQIAIVENNGQLTRQERTVRLNAMRALATQVQEQSKSFRAAQQSFLKKLRDQESVSSSFGFDDDEPRSVVSNDVALNQGLNREQEQMLDDMNDQANEREKEIIKVAQSISDLAHLFKELDVLVIEQGSILDRIDYNVESTLEKTRSGNEQLRQADEHSKKMYTLKAILCLSVTIVILIIILIAVKS